MTQGHENRLVLASGSRARAMVMRGAGLDPLIDPARLDESILKDTARRETWTASETALALAEAKAMEVSARHPARAVLGADQMLEIGEDWLDKPADKAGAQATLTRLQGETHALISGVVLVQDSQVIWSAVETARLTMRSLNAQQIEAYLTAADPSILGSVGAYHLEGLGAQLFEAVEGDFFTVLGLPLGPVLDALRRHFPGTPGLI